MTFDVTLLTGRLAKSGESIRATWPGLVDMLSKSSASQFDSRDFFARSKREQGELKDGPAWVPAHFVGQRSDANTVALSCAVLDFDGLYRYDVMDAWRVFAGFAGIIHTTASHRDSAPRVRVVLPLAAPVLAEKWGAAWVAIVKRFGLRGRLKADSKARNPSRLYYLPTHLSDVTPWAIVRDGKFLDVQELPVPRPAPRAVAPEVQWVGEFDKVARAYIKKLGPAIEGNGGDSLTYRVACILFRDFALGWDEGMQIFREWNNDCSPPWSDAELEQKAKHAVQYGTGPMGTKRTTGRNGKWDADAVRAFVGSAK